MVDEYVDIIDEQGNKIKTVLKSEAHKKGLLHQAAWIFIYNIKGQILLQKRAATMEIFPSCWDISVAGHVSSGDIPLNAAIREAKEEIGIDIKPEELIFMKTYRVNSPLPKQSLSNQEIAHIYLLNLNKEEFTIQKEELDQVKWVSLDSFEEEINDKDKFKKYVPHKIYQEVIEKIRSLLNNS